MSKDEMQTMRKRTGIISKEVCITGICLFAIIFIYVSYLYKYEKRAIDDYLFALLRYFVAGIPLSYALWNFIGGKEKRKQILLGLFAALFVLVLEDIRDESDYWKFALFFLPLVATTCFFAIMDRKSKNRKYFLLSAIPLALLIVTIGFCVYRGGLFNLSIVPSWIIQFSCAAIYLTLAFGDQEKFRIRVQRLLIVYCLLQIWLIYYEFIMGDELVYAFRQILILLWPVAVFAFFNIFGRVRGTGRLFLCYVMVFLGMWLSAEPFIVDYKLKWDAVRVFYLLLTADVVIISENRIQHRSSKKMHEYGVIVLINAVYLVFIVWSSHRIRNILHSLFNENSWGSFRMEALKANISRNPDAAIWRQLNDWPPLLSEMNLNVGMLLPVIIIALTSLMVYFVRKSHCENETAELIKRYLCYAFLLRIVLCVFANLFLITSSRIDFPLLLEGEEDLAVMVMLFLCIFIKQRKSVNVL